MGTTPPCTRPERRTARWPRRAGLLLCLGGIACLGETELVTPPAAPPANLTLEFEPEGEDLETALKLGWENGIPDVEVTLTAEDTEQGPVLRFQGSSDGTLILDALPGGRYVVDAVRWLTEAERDRLPTGDDAVGFVTRFSLSTASASSPLVARLVASRRRGIVISEWKGNPLYAVGFGTYFFSGYLRLYNNADTTVYLDGLIIGRGLRIAFDTPANPCELYRPFVEDPLGIWARDFHQLPGRGSEYPLLPGETAVVATDAIDHRPLFPTGLDLSRASFEYLGPSDVDNPDVPNAPDVGESSLPFGHGLFWDGVAAVAFVALPFDLALIHREAIAGRPDVWARIPQEKIIDLLSTRMYAGLGDPECPTLVHQSLDRQTARFLDGGSADTVAHRRIALPSSIRGQTVLQHTRSSAWDFYLSLRDPFSKP